MILKKAYIRDRLNSLIINFVFKFCKFETEENILIKSMDGIGDILVRSKLAELVVEKNRLDNSKVYFLMKEQYKNLGTFLGYNVIGLDRKTEKNLLKRFLSFMKLIKDINLKDI